MHFLFKDSHVLLEFTHGQNSYYGLGIFTCEIDFDPCCKSSGVEGIPVLLPVASEGT